MLRVQTLYALFSMLYVFKTSYVQETSRIHAAAYTYNFRKRPAYSSKILRLVRILSHFCVLRYVWINRIMRGATCMLQQTAFYFSSASTMHDYVNTDPQIIYATGYYC